MDRLISIFTNNWQQKLIALAIGLLIWFIVNQTLTETKTITNVPIRVISVPDDKMIVGMMPNGLLNRRINLTLTGSKSVIDQLESGDIEVMIDASTFDADDQVIKVGRNQLVNHNPDVDVISHISEVNHPEFVVKLSRVITAKVPIIVESPKGMTPQGYVYLDIWPQKLTQTITGPEEQVEALITKGLKLTFDFQQITKTDLDKIKPSRENFHDDEVSYFVPSSWKKVAIPFRNNTLEEINDPEAQNLHIDFLRREIFPIERELPVRLFYPLITSDTLNPKTISLNTDITIKVKNELAYLPIPLYVKDVSRLFLEVVRDHLMISVVAKKDLGELPWGLSVIAPHELEDKYVSYLISHHHEGKSSEPRHSKKRETHLRTRFQKFLQNLKLYTGPEKRFDLEAMVQGNKVIVHTMSVHEPDPSLEISNAPK